MSQEMDMRTQHKLRLLFPMAMQGCIGVRILNVRTNEGVHTGKICVKTCEFSPMNLLQACRVLTPLVLGAVWAWCMLLRRDFH